MENIINNKNNDNLINESLNLKIPKECPYCNIILPLKEFEDHIICHEIDQNENRNLSYNINGFGLNNNPEGIPKPEKESPNIFQNLFQKVDNFINNNFKKENNGRDGANNINENNNNNNFRPNVNSGIIRLRNNRVKKRVFLKVGNFIKNIMNSDNNRDNEEPFFNFRLERNRRNSNDEINNNNINNIDDGGNDRALDNILNEEDNSFSRDDYNEIIKYIPSNTINKAKNPSDINSKCIICLAELKIGEKESTLPCLHIFHSNCIENWLKQKRTCPICKLEISLVSFLS